MTATLLTHSTLFVSSTSGHRGATRTRTRTVTTTSSVSAAAHHREPCFQNVGSFSPLAIWVCSSQKPNPATIPSKQTSWASCLLTIETIDASRFLAQSQSRISYRPEDIQRNGPDQQRRSNRGTSRFPPSRSNLHRAIGNPYQPSASQASHFPFASRTSAQPAPLFYSATDEFREEDDEQEHEREIADFYALQRSRRHLGASRLQESSEMDDEDYEDEDGKSSATSGDRHQGNYNDRASSRPGGIRSSWRGGKASGLGRGFEIEEPLPERFENDGQSETSSRGKDKMVDVGLDDTMRSHLEDVDRDGPPDFRDKDPPSIQQFRKQPETFKDHFQANSSFLPRETDTQGLLDDHRPPSSAGSSVPPSMAHPDSQPPRHDAFWGNCFLISLVALFSTSFLVWLHTSSAPVRKPGLGDTIYTTLHGSFFLLAVYTLVSVLVSLLWLALLRSYVRPLVYGMFVVVPVILYSFSLYPFISSFTGSYQGSTFQDKAMRWGSIVPAALATTWVYSAVKGRHSAEKAISILEFACRILAANPALLVLGFIILGTIVSWTWLWMLMFTRVFLGGHLEKSRFIIDAGSWWLGAYFILVYIWSLGVIAGIQRAVTAATVSQWYFHRLAIPAPTSRQIVRAAFTHATTTLFGTICLSTLLAMLIRLPLIILPRRLSSIITLAAYSLVPTPIAALTSPLTLTYAAIHSNPLGSSARGLGQMTFLSPSTPATSLHPRSFSSSNNASPLVPYRLAKLLLHATRFMMSLALGFGGWVSTARSLRVTDGGSTIRGSLYAYVVGMIAGALGWGILGAMEGVLAGVVDAAVVCWGSEVGGSGREARYCREAGWLFGGSGNQESDEVRNWGDV